MVVKAERRVPAKPVDRAVRTEIQWLVDRHDGAPNFEMRKFRIRPGGSIPRHYHPDIEHEQYVLAGEYAVGIGERVHRVRPGDSLFIPARTVHWYENDGEENAEFLCIIPRVEKYEAVYLDEESPAGRKSQSARASRRR